MGSYTTRRANVQCFSFFSKVHLKSVDKPKLRKDPLRTGFYFFYVLVVTWFQTIVLSIHKSR